MELQTVNGAVSGRGIEWTPNMMPDGITARLFYTPDVTGGAKSNDKVLLRWIQVYQLNFRTEVMM